MARGRERWSLLSSPILSDGSPDHGNINEVQNPEGENFLKKVNDYFGTTFTEKDFAGR